MSGKQSSNTSESEWHYIPPDQATLPGFPRPTNRQRIPYNVQYGANCRHCGKAITAMSYKGWERKLKQPCPACKRKWKAD